VTRQGKKCDQLSHRRVQKLSHIALVCSADSRASQKESLSMLLQNWIQVVNQFTYAYLGVSIWLI